jgi:hypothetical protein|tara:strand:- start:365 stop:478 length:114 start_codon:yes stop_codon:yes gene_type:complete
MRFKLGNSIKKCRILNDYLFSMHEINLMSNILSGLGR